MVPFYGILIFNLNKGEEMPKKKYTMNIEETVYERLRKYCDKTVRKISPMIEKIIEKFLKEERQENE